MGITDLVREDLRNMVPYSSARTEFNGNAAVFLDANESPFQSGVNRYPDPLQGELKQRLADLKGISSEQLFIGNGSDECIDLIVRLFCRPYQDLITVIAPSYGIYKVSAVVNGVKAHEVMLNPDFSLPVNELLEQAESSKVIFLCTPNNPTGNTFSRQDIIKILKSFEGIVVIDEAYADFSDDPSFISEIELFENLIVLQTLSKGYGMAGLRLGMLIGNPSVVQYLNAIKPPYNVSVLAQDFALEQLKRIELITNNINMIKAERDILMNEMEQLECIEKVFPSSANFFMVRFYAADNVYNRLKYNGIVVRNRSGEPMCNNCLRITIGTRKENELLILELQKFKGKK